MQEAPAVPRGRGRGRRNRGGRGQGGRGRQQPEPQPEAQANTATAEQAPRALENPAGGGPSDPPTVAPPQPTHQSNQGTASPSVPLSAPLLPEPQIRTAVLHPVPPAPPLGSPPSPMPFWVPPPPPNAPNPAMVAPNAHWQSGGVPIRPRAFCDYCRRPGHTLGDCRYLRRDQGKMPRNTRAPSGGKQPTFPKICTLCGPGDHEIQECRRWWGSTALPPASSAPPQAASEPQPPPPQVSDPGPSERPPVQKTERASSPEIVEITETTPARTLGDLSAQVQQEVAEEPRVKTLYHIHGYIAGYAPRVSFMIDTGSTACIMPLAMCKKGAWCVISNETGVVVTSMNGTVSEAEGTVKLKVSLGEHEREVEFLVLKEASQIILGVDALKQFGIEIQCAKERVRTADGRYIYCHAVHVPKN